MAGPNGTPADRSSPELGADFPRGGPDGGRFGPALMPCRRGVRGHRVPTASSVAVSDPTPFPGSRLKGRHAATVAVPRKGSWIDDSHPPLHPLLSEAQARLRERHD